MSARTGRSLLIKKNGTALAGIKTSSVSFSAEGVDITDKLDSGYRTMGDFAGIISFEISGEGVAKGTVARDIFKAGTGFLLTDVTIEWDTTEAWECDVFLSAYEETAAHDGSVDFSITLQSSGAWSEVV
jgi:predicted secreted protein